MTTGSVPLVLQAIEALKRGDRRGSARILRDALSHSAAPSRTWTDVAQLAAWIGEIGMAIEAARRGAEPSVEGVLKYCGTLATYGRSEEAIALIRKQPAGMREHFAVLQFRGMIASERGEFGLAEELYRRALSKNPAALAVWLLLSAIKTFTPGDKDIARMEEALDRPGGSDPDSRARLNYALGKAWDDCGEYDRAFSFYDRGAQIRAGLERYDARSGQAPAERTLRDFTVERLEELVPSQAPPPRSYFVTGLPRSGTTLVQQILIAHSQISDGGEVNLLRPAFIPTIDFSIDGALNYQRRAGADDPWGDLANDYAGFIDMRFRSPGRVVDKSLNQSMLFGLMLHALPDARLIWLRRTPEENALSCFRTYFSSIPWSWSLTDIASHFRIEDRLFEHWRSLFPDRILVLQYEELVKNPQEWLPKVFNYLGLDDEPSAQDFHKKGGNVQTASMGQVRSPLDPTRLNRTKAYETHLQAFQHAYYA